MLDIIKVKDNIKDDNIVTYTLILACKSYF
jgi:hypothetical protein